MITFWIGVATFIIFTIVSLGQYFLKYGAYAAFYDFSAFDWALLAFGGFINAIMFLFLARALKLDNPVRLSIYDYFSVIF